MPSEETRTEIRGIEPQPPQVTFRCVDCEQRAGEHETGMYFMFSADEIPVAIDREGWHVIDNAVVCDECAYNREHKDGTDAH